MANSIGILTIHNALNYGSTLQALALQEYVRKKGLDCKIIDYQNQRLNGVYGRDKTVKKLWPLIIAGKMKQAYYEAMEMRAWRRHSPYATIRKPYDRFRKKYLKLTKPVYPHALESFDKFDAIIAGSDQIWSDIVGDDAAYYLDFPRYKGLKIAYAASGTETMVTANVQRLKKFDHISVREEGLQQTLQILGMTDVPLVCDPTLLFGKDFWKTYVKKPSREKKYIFAYLMFEEPHIREYISYLEKHLGLPVVILYRMQSFVMLNGEKIAADTPQDFLTLISQAAYVVTNSFHGTVFSALFHKNFVSYICDDRITSLLEAIGLSSRMVHHTAASTFDITQPIDWSEVEQKIEKFRLESDQFLKKSLHIV